MHFYSGRLMQFYSGIDTTLSKCQLGAKADNARTSKIGSS